MNVFEDLYNDPNPTLGKIKIAIVELINSGYTFEYDSDDSIFILIKKRQVYIIAPIRKKTPEYLSKKVDVLQIKSEDWNEVLIELTEFLDEPEREKFYSENVKQIRSKKVHNFPIYKNQKTDKP